jgi:ABC-type uncharacterized transport system permease subunit
MKAPWSIFRIEKRVTPSRWAVLLVPLLSVVLGLACGALFLISLGVDPVEAYRELFTGSFGSRQALYGTLIKAIPLMLCALGISLAFRMTLWNIGAEGQLLMGAAAATWFALHFPDAPTLLALPSMILLSMLAGGLWCLIAGALKAYWEVNEIIVTLMLNYIAIHLLDYLIFVPWKDPRTYGFPMTPEFGQGARLPVLFGSRVHAGLVFAAVAAALLYFLYRRTTFGFEIRAIGANPRAARYAGMNIKRTILLVMFFSGALAGLAGMSEVAGLHHRLQPGFSTGYGYTAIIVAWLSNLHPAAILVVSVLFGGLLTGGDMIQITMQLPLSLINILQASILFFILGGEFFRFYRLRLRKE